MLKLSTKGNELVITNDFGRCISFDIQNKGIFNVIKKNIESLNKDGCELSIEKRSETECYIILNSYKIMIPSVIVHEISSRMLLMNNMIVYPLHSSEESEIS